MKYSNAVPQDGVFNKGVWKWAETELRDNYIKPCLKEPGYKALVITGAVPAYFGPYTNGKPFKIGKTNNNVYSSKRSFPGSAWRGWTFPADKELEKKMTVPTHMWTQFVCYDSNKVATTPPPPNAIWSRLSFIGLNYRTGFVKLYEGDITSTLKKMYGKGSLGIFDSGPYMEELRGVKKDLQDAVRKKLNGKNPPDKVCDPEHFLEWTTNIDGGDGWSCSREGTEDAEGPSFWDKVDIQEIREDNENARLGYLLGQYKRRTIWGQIEDKTVDWFASTPDEVIHTGNPYSPNKRYRYTGSNRVKRSTDEALPQNLTTETLETFEQNLTRYSFNVIDQDPRSNFKLKQCQILEESTEGEVIETHVYDFENNLLFEDQKTDSGSNLTVFYIADDDGAVDDLAERELAPNVVQKVTLSISDSQQTMASNSTSTRNLTSYTFSVIDEDPASDLELKDCRFWEKVDGEVIETHTYNSGSNVLIEDNKVDSGGIVTAVYTDEGGAEVAAEKDVTQEETIFIVLRPR